ncbi:hypothetical protein CUMW_122230 [Citrus unshiu]|nr:hypothetical protein CUMW_122230 [Citrus unshiu]
MEGASNGGMLYHEVQESKLCAVHCVNTVLQGPFFSEFDLAALASDLDRSERQVMLEGRVPAASSGDFLTEESHNVSLDGDFSIQVLQKALEVWDLQWLSPEDAERITKSCNTREGPKRIKLTQQHSDPFLSAEEADRLLEMEDEDLKAAIAASLLDSSPAKPTAEASSTTASTLENEKEISKEKTAQED